MLAFKFDMFRRNSQDGRTRIPGNPVSGKRLQQQSDVLCRLYLLEDLRNFLVWTDEKSRPLGTHVFFPVHAFFNPHAVRIYHRLVRIAEERKRKAVISNEFSVALYPIYANSEKLRFGLDFTPGIAEIAGLFRTAGRLISGVKIKYERRPLEIGKFHFLAAAINSANGHSFKVRSLVTNLKFHRLFSVRSCHASEFCAIHFAAPSPAIVPVTKQPWRR